jgi:hypothetical protein
MVSKRPYRRRQKRIKFFYFATYEPARQARKLKKAASEIKEGEMPLESYLLIHKDAKLTPQQKELLVTYFNTMKDVTMITNKISEEELKPKKPNLDFERKILYFL